MNTIKQWLSNHSISSQTFASAWVFITALFYISPPFHDYIMTAYGALPKGIHAFATGIIIPALIFWRSQKKTTVTATIDPGETGTAVVTAKALKEGPQ